MGKRLMLLLVFALVLGLVIPAYAEVQNIKVSGDITMYGISRNNFNLGIGLTESDDKENTNSSILRLRLDADLTENVTATVRLLNERDWDQEAVSASEIVVDLANVTLKEFLYSPLTLTLGRQELHFGNDFIIGDPDRNNSAAGTTITDEDLSTKKAFDAARATLNYDPLVIDLFWAKVDENTSIPTAAAEERDDIDLYGINARYDFGGNWKTIGEMYYFAKNDDSATDLAATIANKKSTEVHNLGARVDITPTARLNLQGEFVYQMGHTNTSTAAADGVQAELRAQAAQGIVRYDLTDKKLHPVLMGIYSYYSGSSTGDNTNHNWDPMFENQTSGHIANVLLDPSNSHTLNLRGSIVPMEDLTVTLDLVYLALAQGLQGANSLATYTQNHTQVLHASSGERHLGTEVDLALTYDYTEDVQLGLMAGVFSLGDAFDQAPQENVREVIASVKVSF